MKAVPHMIVILIQLLKIELGLSQVFQVTGSVSVASHPAVNVRLIFQDQADSSSNYSTTTDSQGVYRLDVLTSTPEAGLGNPEAYQLLTNYPNPFADQTTILSFGVQSFNPRVAIYDIVGRKVRELELVAAGKSLWIANWNGLNTTGQTSPAGVYLYSITSPHGIKFGKLLRIDAPGTNVSRQDIRSALNPASPLHPASAELSEYSVTINNTPETFPKIVKASYDNIGISSDTVLNFTVETARLIPGESIDGVLPGDDSLSVVSKLGPPDLITPAGDLDGWAFFYLKPDNPHSYMAVIISMDTSYGLGVIHVEVEAPYRGETPHAIGLGSPRYDVLRALGAPFYTDSTGPMVDFYSYSSPVPSFSFTQCLFWYDQAYHLLYRIQFSAFLSRSQRIQSLIGGDTIGEMRALTRR